MARRTGAPSSVMSIQEEYTIEYSVAKIGAVRMGEVENILEVANTTQRAYRFVAYPRKIDIDIEPYKLPNGAFDLDKAAAQIRRELSLSTPFIFLTGLPYGCDDTKDDPEYTYFIGHEEMGEGSITIISTYNWEHVLRKEDLQPYMLLMLACEAFRDAVDLPYHLETRGCIFDYDLHPGHITRVLRKSNPLCIECETRLFRAVREGRASAEQVAAAIRLARRAADKKTCFVAMPFEKAMRTVYDRTARALRTAGWFVQRADEIARPRSITDALLLAVMTSDLFVADITGENPNVFYELGLAHAHHIDSLIITQDKPVPFDITTERVISYKPTARGLLSLGKEVTRHAGNAHHRSRKATHSA